MVHIIHPEDKNVSNETIIGWAIDAWFDNEDCGHKPLTLEDSIDMLQDLGLVTVANS